MGIIDMSTKENMTIQDAKNIAMDIGECLDNALSVHGIYLDTTEDSIIHHFVFQALLDKVNDKIDVGVIKRGRKNNRYYKKYMEIVNAEKNGYVKAKRKCKCESIK